MLRTFLRMAIDRLRITWHSRDVKYMDPRMFTVTDDLSGGAKWLRYVQ